MAPQTQKEYWQDQWEQRDFDKQVASAEKKAWWAELLRLLEDVGSDDLVVEAGCGLCQFVYRIHGMGHRIVGIDITDATLERVREHHAELDLRAMDVREMDFPDSSVKFMLSLGVLEHFEEGPDDLLREAARVIEPGGVFFATVPYSNVYRRMREPWRRLQRSVGKRLGLRSFLDAVFYQYTYARKDMIRRLAEHGFEVEKTLLHHSHVAVKKDLAKNYLFRAMNLNLFSSKPITSHRYRRWGKYLDRISPSLMSHICLYIARRV